VILEFIIDNAIYIGLALGSGIALLWPLLSGSAGGVTNLTPAQAVLLMNQGKVLILDVRNEEEFASGHIQGAKNIPMSELAERVKEIEKFKEKEVLVHCQRGIRSKAACSILRGQEFTLLANLQGGIDSWIDAKMPLVK